MYCSSCGLAVPKGLSYCNRCGAELQSKEPGSFSVSQASRDSLIWAIVGVTTVGLGGAIGLMAVMKEVLHFNDGLIIALTLLTFAAFLSIDAVFIWILLRSFRREQQGDTAQLQEAIRRALQTAQTPLLAEPAPSVTDHTTRTLEPVLRRTRAKVADTDRMDERNSELA